jgi:hypothetical protein
LTAHSFEHAALKLDIEPPCQETAFKAIGVWPQTQKVITEDGWLFDTWEVCCLPNEIRAVCRVEQNIARLDQEAAKVSGAPWNTASLGEVELALSRDVVHAKLEDAFCRIFPARKSRSRFQ